MTRRAAARQPFTLTGFERWVLLAELVLAATGVAVVVAVDVFGQDATGFEHIVPFVLLLPTSAGLLWAQWPIPRLGDLPLLQGLDGHVVALLSLTVFALLAALGNWLLVVMVSRGVFTLARHLRAATPDTAGGRA